MRLIALACALALALLPACGGGSSEFSLADEFGFRQLREDFHQAVTTGDYDLLRSLWTDDAVLTTGTGQVLVGGDAIADFLAANPDFGQNLLVTTESSWSVAMQGDVGQYGFESVSVDVGGGDPETTLLADGGAQSPGVEIVGHSHSTGLAVRGGDGRWMFHELTGGAGPLPPGPEQSAGSGGAAVQPESGLSVGDELGFRRMRETFHLANLLGDADLMRTVWADDAVFRGGPNEFFGRDAIVDFFSGTAGFGRYLVVTPEASQRITINGDIAEYGFECIAIDVGGADPQTVDLCAADGTQNPDVEIIRHTHSIGRAMRVAEGRWVFLEFNGGSGPLPDPE